MLLWLLGNWKHALVGILFFSLGFCGGYLIGDILGKREGKQLERAKTVEKTLEIVEKRNEIKARRVVSNDAFLDQLWNAGDDW